MRTAVRKDAGGVYRVDRNGKLFIAHREAIALGAYQDGPHMSIGMGYNNPSLQDGDTITVQRAFELLNSAIAEREVKMSKKLKVPPTQEQFNALMSAYYQSGNRFVWDLVDMHNNHEDIKFIGSAFSRPEHCTTKGGQFLSGLEKRRKLEGVLYERGEYEEDLDVVTLYHGNPRIRSTRTESYKVTLEDLPA